MKLMIFVILIVVLPILLVSKSYAHELSMVCDEVGIKARWSTPHGFVPDATHAYKYEKNLLGKFTVFDKQGAGEWKEWCTLGEGTDRSPYKFSFAPTNLIATCIVKDGDATTLNFRSLIFELKKDKLLDNYWASKSRQKCVLR